MSRIGKQPIQIPNGVTMTVDNKHIVVQGPKGTLEQFTMPGIGVEVKENQVFVTRMSDTKIHRSKHGLMRTLISNMVIGVTEGYSKKLEVSGVGYKIALSGNTIKLNLGFSHQIDYKVPEGISVKIDKMDIELSGINKQLVGQVAAEIRAFKKPEPYKGKGIKYAGERVLRKSGKSGKE
jgi:large subunit ribosomal protein L6